MSYLANPSAEIDRLEAELTRIEEVDLWHAEAEFYSGSFSEFCKAAWNIIEPGRPLKWNWHHDLMCAEFEAFMRREFSRGFSNVPPRHTKSTIFSVCGPAWVWTWAPNHQFLCLSNSDELAIRDAVKARRLMESAWYVERFRLPHWKKAWDFASDQSVKSFYENNRGGHRLSQGILSKVTGKGGDSILVDDPHDAKDVYSDAKRINVIEAWDNSVESRLNDQITGGIYGVMQRLHHRDWCGHVLARDGRRIWRVCCLPQEYEPDHPLVCKDDVRTERGHLLWPEGVDQNAVDRQKKTWPPMTYAGQAQQRPTPASGGILRKTDWKPWDTSIMGPAPKCHYIIDSWDTAHSEEAEKKPSRSALSRWGVFYNERHDRNCIILLYSWAGHVSYPDLRRKALKEYKEHQPDAVLVEKKASGQSLIQDLRQASVPVIGYNPDRDKIARANAVSAILEAGLVYYIEGKIWAQEHIEECGAFPRGQYSDLVDTTTQAWLRIKNMWLVEHPDNPPPPHPDDADRDDAAEVTGAIYG